MVAKQRHMDKTSYKKWLNKMLPSARLDLFFHLRCGLSACSFKQLKVTKNPCTVYKSMGTRPVNIALIMLALLCYSQVGYNYIQGFNNIQLGM